MTVRRLGSLIAVLLAVGLLIAPTGGFSSSVTDRGIGVSVSPDDEAYLGIQSACTNNTLQVSLTNQFPSGTTLDIEIAVNETLKTISNLPAGVKETTEFDTISRGDSITVAASGSDISVQLVRPLPTGC
jgi:hypothetical protein